MRSASLRLRLERSIPTLWPGDEFGEFTADPDRAYFPADPPGSAGPEVVRRQHYNPVKVLTKQAGGIPDHSSAFFAVWFFLRSSSNSGFQAARQPSFRRHRFLSSRMFSPMWLDYMTFVSTGAGKG